MWPGVLPLVPLGRKGILGAVCEARCGDFILSIANGAEEDEATEDKVSSERVGATHGAI